MKLKQWIQIFPILSGIMWGSAGIFVRKLSELGLNSVSIVETRIIVAIIIIIAGLLCLDKKLLKIKLKDLWIFICAGIFSMLGLNLCYNFAINELTLSLSAVLLSLAPIFVLILASILFKEKLTLQKTVCAILALIGCILSSGVLEEVGAMKWTTIGIIIGTLGAFFYGTYSIFSKIAMLKGYHSFTVTIYSLMAVGIALLPFTDWLKVWEIIQIAPLAYMRGRTLNDAFVILDEAQNTTRNQLKMFLTRMGVNAKFVITGDMSQIDLPKQSDSGLIHAFKLLHHIKGIAFVEFDNSDIVRHRLVKEIVNAYNNEEKTK